MDIALKQRLVGASVLIALAVVVLPMLLGGRPERGEQPAQKIELPPQPSQLDFQTRRYPVGDAPALPADGGQDAPSGPLPGQSPGQTMGGVAHVELPPRDFQDALQDEPAPDQVETEPSAAAAAAEAALPQAEAAAAGTEQAPAPEPDLLPSQPLPATVGSGRYVVQVASFGSIGNAHRLSETLRGHGHDVLADTVTSDAGTMHRVRVGPYDSAAKAGEAADRVRKQVPDVKPRIVDLRPEATAQVTTPGDPLVRWVVQVGSFSAPANAETLVERLRAEGLSAYTESVSTSGATVYRVRVGPYLERDEALNADRLVNERLSLDGVVMSAD